MGDPEGKDAAEPGTSLPSALEHRLRSQILLLLGERSPASAKDIAAALSEPHSSVSEQLRRLCGAALVEVVENKKRRGALERLYRATDSSRLLSDGEMALLPESKRKSVVLRVVRVFLSQVQAALANRELGIADDSQWFYATVEVDSQGWHEMAEIHLKALHEAERVRSESAQRLEDVPAESRRAGSAIFFFELSGKAEGSGAGD